MERVFPVEEFIRSVQALSDFKFKFKPTSNPNKYVLEYKPHARHDTGSYTKSYQAVVRLAATMSEFSGMRIWRIKGVEGVAICLKGETPTNEDPMKNSIAFLDFFHRTADFNPKYKVASNLKQVKNMSDTTVLSKYKKSGSNVDLSLLGVPAVLRFQKPSASTFPSAFNAHSRNIWNSILNDQDIMTYLSKKSSSDQWEFVIKEYIAQCKKVGMPIFSERYCEELNVQLSTDFNRLRNKLVEFVQKNEIIEGINMYSIKHEVQKLPTGGFDLYVSAKLRKVDGARVEKHISCLGNRGLWTEKNKEESIRDFDPLGKFFVSSDLNKNGKMSYRIRAPHSPFVSARSMRDLTENKYLAKAKSLWISEIEKAPLVFAKKKGRRKKKLVLF